MKWYYWVIVIGFAAWWFLIPWFLCKGLPQGSQLTTTFGGTVNC